LEIFICPPSEAARRVSEKLQKEMSCKCIDLMGDNEISRKTGPLQFLELISRAKYICTDSFHAVAFSLLFNKQFLVFERSDHSQKKDSRFETLFSKLNINREVLSDDSSSEELNGFIEKTIDYSKIEPLLESEREKSWQQIKKALRYIGLGD
jgi:exopolysaccharide biosynthesis predicted pyruvyltransferase EpsI